MELFDHIGWTSVFRLYDCALRTRATKLKSDKKNDLIELDKWYQTELPTFIEERKPKHITHEELCKLMKWKLLRGKFRPRLTELVKCNSEQEVKDASTKAFKCLPDISAAVQALTVLKAVGPATASGILAAGAPKHVAFMADESMQAIPGLAPIKYDLSFFKEYMKHIKELVKRLNSEDPKKSWTPHKVELTLWTYQIAKTMDENLYNKITDSTEENNTEEPPRKKVKTR